ncbi:glycosyl transferase family 1, partial [Patescibacteria group bacterium]|nr:glycosyl transferase family 1 [Patescibacteria group bacterium]
MKILLISSYLPYPLFSGGQIRLYNLLKELSRNHRVTLICEKRGNQTESDVKEIEKICEKV